MMDFEAEAKDVTADTTITEIETGPIQSPAANIRPKERARR
jgi:hypothetical protein